MLVGGRWGGENCGRCLIASIFSSIRNKIICVQRGWGRRYQGLENLVEGRRLFEVEIDAFPPGCSV